jgi:hypothetical protein
MLLYVQDRIEKLDYSIIADTSLGPALFEELRAAQRKLGLLQGNRKLPHRHMWKCLHPPA